MKDSSNAPDEQRKPLAPDREEEERPRQVDVAEAADDENEERILRNAWPPASKYFFDWLRTPDGAELAQKVAELFESVRHATLGRQHRIDLADMIARYALVAGIISAGVYLRSVDKLDTVIVGLLSAALGFLLGRQRLK